MKGTPFPYVHAPHTQNPHNPSLSRFKVSPHAQTKHFVVNQILFMQHNIQIFLIHIQMVSICIHDNQFLTL